MNDHDTSIDTARRALKRPLRLTRFGLFAERFVRAFWPVWTLLFAGLAPIAFGALDAMPDWAVWAVLALWALALGWALVVGIKAFAPPRAEEAAIRLDGTLPGRPVAALSDTQVIGAGDEGSRAVWAAHRTRMARIAATARPVRPDLRLSEYDRFGLRYVAGTALVTALLFGSLWRVGDVAQIAMPGGEALQASAAWEGWIEPPAYTRKPALYLNDIAEGAVTVPQGSRVTLRLYGEQDALQVVETVSASETALPGVQNAKTFRIDQAGRIAVEGEGGRAWQIVLTPDGEPSVEFNGAMFRRANGEMQQPFAAADDFGVLTGVATIALDLPSVDRRYGLASVPEPRPEIVLDLPMPISGNRASFEELLVDNLSQHPWVGLPVQIRLSVEDARAQQGLSELMETSLPGLTFFDPLARAVIEQRRDLMWTRENGDRVLQLLRAVTHRPDEIFRDSSAYLQLRQVMRQLEQAQRGGGLTPEQQTEMAQVLWDIATLIEFGDLADAAERMRRAQDRLEQAMRNGASDEEIAELMRELQEAMDEYIRQLAEQQRRDGNQDQADTPDSDQGDRMEITGDQLQQMLDEIQRLMEEGRMAEAMALMEQLRQMMENLQVTERPGGQGGQQSPGQQSMEDLAETLRDQQGLSDDAFRDLQEQFGQQQGGDQAGRSQQNQGRGGQDGRGQSHSDQPGQGSEQGQNPGGEGLDAESLADRQRALRRQLEQLQRNLPGIGGGEGEQARRSLDEAGEAMDRAEDALRSDDLADALDHQSDAIDALRDGMRNLGESLAQQQQQQNGQQGQQQANNGDPSQRRDPLGREGDDRNPNINGSETNGGRLDGGSPLARAQELMDEIRRRSSEQSRSGRELDYLKRLLDQF